MEFTCKHYKARDFLWEFENEGVMILALSNKYSTLIHFDGPLLRQCKPAKTHMLQKVAQLMLQKAFPVKPLSYIINLAWQRVGSKPLYKHTH